MKLVKYVLNADGTIPSHIIDGGYFGVSNDNANPQDVTLLGFTNDDSQESAFNTKEEFANYLESADVKNINPITKEVLPLADLVDFYWNKIVTF